MTTHVSCFTTHGYLKHLLISKTTNTLIIGQLTYMTL